MDLRLRVLMYWILLLMFASSCIGLKCLECGPGSGDETKYCSEEETVGMKECVLKDPICVAVWAEDPPHKTCEFKQADDKLGCNAGLQKCVCNTDGCTKGKTFEDLEKILNGGGSSSQKRGSAKGSGNSNRLAMWTGATVIFTSIAFWLNFVATSE